MRLLLLFSLCLSALTAVQGQFITHGPVMGGATDSSIRFYIRTDSARSFEIELDSTATFSSPLIFSNSTQTGLDNSVITNINGLQADTKYYYRVRFGTQLDTVKTGHFHSFPTEGQPAHFTFVAGSCQETANMKVYDVIPTYNPLFMLHLGDFTYPSYQLPSSYPSDGSMIALSYQRRYEELVMKDRLLPYTPLVYMPDDDDNWGISRNYHISTGYTGSTGAINNFFITDTISQIERNNCLRGYRNFFPGYATVDTTEGHYHSFKVGSCEFFVLDTRSMADPLFEAFRIDTSSGNWVFDPPVGHSIIGQNQMNWLLNGLSNSTAKWKFIVSGVPINPKIDFLIQVGLFAQQFVFTVGGETGTGFRLAVSFAGYWAGFPNDIQLLRNHIQNNSIEGVLFISGDTHHNVMDDGTNSMYPELNASGLSVTTTELAYQINQYSQVLGVQSVTDSLWNGGGNGLHNTNFKNAFGKVEVFGVDSVQYCVVDEDDVALSCMMIYADGSVNNPLGIDNAFPINQAKGLPANLKIYPNPNKGEFNIALNGLEIGDYQLELVGISGQLVYQKKLAVITPNHQESIAVPEEITNGSYFVIIKHKNGNVVAAQSIQIVH